jgi:DNA-directed RNA polymerase specialized sigma24 family protein
MNITSDLASTASGADPRVGLKAASALRRLAETLEAAQVANARRQGWSWQDIAEVLGVSRQAVHQKHSAAEKGRGGRDV